MRFFTEASEKLLNIGVKNSGIDLPPMPKYYTITVLTKYFTDYPVFDFTERYYNCKSPGDFVQIAEDSLMYCSLYRTYTSNRLGKGGVEYVRNVSLSSYSRAGLTEVIDYFTDITTLLTSINTETDFGRLIEDARQGDDISSKKLANMGIHVLF